MQNLFLLNCNYIITYSAREPFKADSDAHLAYPKEFFFKIQPALNIWTCAGSSIDTKTDRKRKTIFFKYCASHVTYHVLRFKCRLSLTPTATATAKVPPPAYSPIMYSRLVCKGPKNFKRKKTIGPIQKKCLQVCQYQRQALYHISPVHREAIFPRQVQGVSRPRDLL